MRSRGRTRTAPVATLLAALVVLAGGPVLLPSASGSSYPLLPLALDRWFVSNLTGAEVAPSGGGTISFSVGDPLAGTPIASAWLRLEVYAFDAFPGNATSPVAVSTAPVLVNATASGLGVNESLGTLTPGPPVVRSVMVQSSATTPSGTFAVRTALRFVANGTPYLLESRGWFTAAQWASATGGPNGSVVLNLSALGVSGILPETSILVTSSSLSSAIWVVLGAGLVLVGAAAWLYFRSPKSRSGVGKAPGDIQAPRAFGRRRTKDGD